MSNIITLATKAMQELIKSGIDTLTSRLTATRASNLDKLDATISSRSTLTAQQVWSAPSRTLTQSISAIKSIQTGVTDFSDPMISAINVKISSVVPAKSIVILNCEFGSAGNISNFAKAQGSAELTSSTNLRLTRALGETGPDVTTRYRWQVIEFY